MAGLQPHLDILELQMQVGVSEELTSQVLSIIRKQAASPALLPVYNLMLLENYDETIPLIKATMASHLDLEYITSLQKSRFPVQRKCAPMIADAVDPVARRSILRTSLSDSSIPVIREAVSAVRSDNPFDRQELRSIHDSLAESSFMDCRVLAVDILACGLEDEVLLSSALHSSAWRIRLRCATLLDGFSAVSRQLIVDELKTDHIEEVRMQLAKNIHSLESIEYLSDPSELVRSSYLSNVIKLIQDESILAGLINDQSWEVRKILLSLRGPLFKKITIPLIQNSTENVIQWRSKIEVLDLVDEQIGDDYVARLLTAFLFKTLGDRVCAVRERSRDILIKVLAKYDWFREFSRDIEDVISGSGYLHRIAVLPVAIAFDRKYSTQLSSLLMADRVANVRHCYSQWSREAAD